VAAEQQGACALLWVAVDHTVVARGGGATRSSGSPAAERRQPGGDGLPVAVEWRWSTSGPVRAHGAARLSPRKPIVPWPQEPAARRGCSGGYAVPAAEPAKEAVCRLQ
jgi:hypothetical protein